MPYIHKAGNDVGKLAVFMSWKLWYSEKNENLDICDIDKMWDG